MTGADLSAMAVTVERVLAAPLPDVWALVSDLPRMAGFSPEVESLVWTDPVTFTAVNRTGGSRWTVTGHVVERRAPTLLRWTVLSPRRPSSTWSYELVPAGGATRVVHRFQHGPGPSGVRGAVEARPAAAAQVVAERSAQLAAGMTESLLLADRWLAEQRLADRH